MPNGQSPRSGALAKLAMLDAELKRAKSDGKMGKLKSLLDSYKFGYTGKEKSAEVKKLEAKIEKRASSLLANANKMGSDKRFP